MDHKIQSLVFTIILFTFGCNAQTESPKAELIHEFDRGSGIGLIDPTPQTIDKLGLLCKVWGFLKYYHPEISAGNYNWDYELFRIMPQVLNSSHNEELNSALLKWVDNLGNVEISNYKAIDSSTIKMKPDYKWIKEGKVGEKLSERLKRIQQAKRSNEHYYVAFGEFPPPIFQNENAYSDMKYPDTGFRLLALFRYWNIIQYYYPYKYLIDDNWHDVLEEFIPVFIEASNELEYHLAVLALITKISDTHATFTSKVLEEDFKGKYVAPVEITFVENKPVVTGFLNRTEQYIKLQIGDIIEELNETKISILINEKSPYIPASNDAAKLREMAWDLLRSNDSIMTIGFIRNQNLEKVKIKGIPRDKVNPFQRMEYQDSCFKLITSEIAYLNPWTLRTKHIPTIIKYIESTKGIIIDLRYPFFEPPYPLLNHLLPKQMTFAKLTKGNLECPGLFTFFKEIEIGEINDQPYKGKVMILNNEFTQSSAEFTTMAFRLIPNSIVVGSTTAGANGAISRFSLPGGIHTLISGSGVYYPNGMETQRIGIIPDVTINPTINDIKEGRDVLIEKAVEIINIE